MSSRIARKYAKALYATLVSDPQAREQFASESLVISEAFQHPRLQPVFANPVLPDNIKRELVDSILNVLNVSPFLKNFCRGVALADRSSFIAQIMNETRKILASASGIVEVRLTSAIPLTIEQEKNIQSMLAKATNSQVILEKDIDPSILGGVVLTMGNNRLDLSLSKKIKEFERSAIN